MKKIQAAVLPKHFELITKALDERGISGMTLTEVTNVRTAESADPHYSPPIHYRGKIEIVVNDDQVDEVLRVILQTKPKNRPWGTYSFEEEYSNEIIFVSPVEQVIDIGPEESGDSTI